ncbi:hypothetical protein PIB30_078254 [Stylosanthes scabra]|uniref:Uncharacterized protein n=1 Tax=Stylosanthes scabra TaxID=79078 RepID=A0ABU6XP49_9FABA|nr:hypothetical protein [Stylosanthes scabra]
MRGGGDKLRVAANGASIGVPDQKLSRLEAADEQFWFTRRLGFTLAALRVPQSPPLKIRTPPSRASPRLAALKDSPLPPSPTSVILPTKLLVLALAASKTKKSPIVPVQKDPEIPIPEIAREEEDPEEEDPEEEEREVEYFRDEEDYPDYFSSEEEVPSDGSFGSN